MLYYIKKSTESKNFRVSKALGSITGRHEFIEFDNLEEMLANFPGTNLETWKIIKDSSLIKTHSLKFRQGIVAEPKIEQINDDFYFNHFERRFNSGKQKTFILYGK